MYKKDFVRAIAKIHVHVDMCCMFMCTCGARQSLLQVDPKFQEKNHIYKTHTKYNYSKYSFRE